MPLLTLRTNLTLDDDTHRELLPRLSQATAELLGKPERYVMVVIEPAAAMSFAGTPEPCALIELKSIGLPEDQTKHYSATLCELIERHLDIAPERIYLDFTDVPRAMWGWNRTTFQR